MTLYRKYGIRRFEKTVLRPKSKLTPEEKEAAEERRKEIIKGLMKQGLQIDKIQTRVKKLGTNKGDDPISNQLATLLEIAYANTVVHVPIKRSTD